MNALLIDAENLNGVSIIAEAYRTIERNHGPIDVAMVFGAAVHLAVLRATCEHLGILVRETAYAQKNAADRKLIRAAERLASRPSRPLMIAIGSGDADFHSLSRRLRSKGVVTACVARGNNTSKGATAAFDVVHAIDSWQMQVATDEQLETAILDCMPELRQGRAIRVVEANRLLRLWRIVPKGSAGAQGFARVAKRFDFTEEMGVAYVRHVR